MKLIVTSLIVLVLGVAIILGNAWEDEKAHEASELLREWPAQQGRP